MNKYIFPVVNNEPDMPLYVRGVGAIDPQYHVVRQNGYCFDQVLFCASGAGKLIVSGREYMITENMCIFLPKSVPHEYFSIGDKWEIKWVCFGGRSVKEVLSNLHLTEPFVINIQDISFEPLFKKMYTALTTDGVFGGYTASAIVYELIISLFRQKNIESGQQGSPKNHIISLALDYIEKNLAGPITIESIAQQCKVTPQHLCRVFKEALDIRPFEYINRKRIQKAKELLIESQLPVSEIGLAVGYGDCSYFSAVFKKIENITPRDFREQNKSQSKNAE